MQMNNIKCPHCGKQIEVSHALSSQIEQEILQKEEARHKKELEEARRIAEESSLKKAEHAFGVQLKLAKEEALANEERNRQLIEQISKLSDERRQLKKEQEELEITMKKKLEDEEEKIRTDAQKKAEEEQRLKILEKDKQLENALKEVEDMRRKLQQGSQQLQGETFEQIFEEMLTKEFPNDKISPVGKGIRGGDIIQEIWDRNGNFCGKILWELKNTKTWSEQWIDKLKTDQREATAEYAVIISEVVPPHVSSAKFHRGIWITKQVFVTALAYSLRLNIIQLAMGKRALDGKKEKTDILYSYLSSTEFKHRIEAIVEAFTRMQDEIEKEKRYFSNKWARDEKNIRQVIDNTYGMHGDLKGIIGAALPQIKGLDEVFSLESGDANDNKTNV